MAAWHALPSFQEFSERCMQLHGPARSVDLCPGNGLGMGPRTMKDGTWMNFGVTRAILKISG